MARGPSLEIFRGAVAGAASQLAASREPSGRLPPTPIMFWTGKQQTRRVAYVCQALMERSDEKIGKVRSLTQQQMYKGKDPRIGSILP